VTLNDARFRIKQPNEYSGPARKEFGIPRKDECTTLSLDYSICERQITPKRQFSEPRLLKQFFVIGNREKEVLT